MAVGEGSTELEDGDHATPSPNEAERSQPAVTNEDTDDEDEDEEEPRLKYAPLTRSLSSLYRNGDATSASLVAGDKMIVGTHNGSIHVFSMPSLQSLKVYRAHTASVSSVSISPYPPPLPVPTKLDAAQRLAAESAESSNKSPSSSPKAKASPKQPPVPKAPSNEIYIATSSIDGNVCVASLVDPDDVQLRNFGRPVQAVALSPDFKSDKSYLSGGQAGSLILTTGGQAGKSTNATTTGAAATASGWLGVIGLGGHAGTDKILHGGEGTISTIKWSLSGKYVLWVNEQGIKIMRSNLHLDSSESGLEWKRVSHINRPEKPSHWEDMAGVWKARAEWIDRSTLESDEDPALARVSSSNGNAAKKPQPAGSEEVIVGWGDTTWIIRVIPGNEGSDKGNAEASIGRAEITAFMRFDDCTISGISLYTPTLILVLAHMENKDNDNDNSKTSDEVKRRGRQHRHNALEPELRLIDINSNEEVDTDTLSVSRFGSLSSSDYHLGILLPVKIPAHLASRGYLNALGSGLGSGVTAIGSGVTAVGSGIYQGVETVGQGVWDATMYAPRKLGANRLFVGNDAGSIRSGKTSADPASSARNNNYLIGWLPGLGTGSATNNEDLGSVATTQGIKIFVFSPFDCIVAVKRNMTDRIQWLTKMERYREAWELLDEHPEAAGVAPDRSASTSPPSPSRASSFAPSGSIGSPPPAPTNTRQQATLLEFFADSASVISPQPAATNQNSAAEKEKRRIGELWLQQLTGNQKWTEAGEVAGRVLNTTPRWEHWSWIFIRNKKFSEISPYIPTLELIPPLPSSIYEVILGHFVAVDQSRFKELIDQWPSDLFEISTVTTAIEDQLKTGDVPKNSKDWRLLQECLAKLYLADGHYKEALRCYIRLQDADTAMTMIKDYHLVDAIADDIPSLVLLRIPSSQLRTSSQQDLEELSSDPIKMLVDEATHGVVGPEEVVAQLENANLPLFLFFYIRALWRGEGTEEKKLPNNKGRKGATADLAANDGKLLVEQFADTAVESFAQYDRDLLMEFLQTSTSYTFEKALQICEKKKYIEEEVYLLSKTGSLKKALYLIIDELKDVSKAIAFAKEQDDQGLWDDLLEYSMSRPKFISGLLAEVGTAIDPITLVKRIPSGIEIEGLKDGLKKMIREYDLQHSISSGVAQVLSSEVAVSMETLRQGRRRGIKFDVPHHSRKKPAHEMESKVENSQDINSAPAPPPEISPGHCAECGEAFKPGETETLVGFACGHVYHVSHLFRNPDDQEQGREPSLPKGSKDDEYDATLGFTWSIGPKVTTARLLKDKIEALGGCKVCKARRMQVEE